MHYSDFLEKYPQLKLIGNTPLINIPIKNANMSEMQSISDHDQKSSIFDISAKIEYYNLGGSIKDRPIARMLIEAIISGELSKEKTIIDSSSGNAGISYAMIGSILGINVEIVVPANASEERKKRIIAHGGKLIMTDALKGYDEALKEAHRRYEKNKEKYYMADQYKNKFNWMAHYDTTAEEILEQTNRKLTHFVAGVGTGGTITGVGRKLKEFNKNIKIICVKPERFPGIEGLKPMGHKDDIIPEIFDDSIVDEYIPVSSDEALTQCKNLAKIGFFIGQSSGAYMHAALKVAEKYKNTKIVTVFSDFGERYFSTHMWD